MPLHAELAERGFAELARSIGLDCARTAAGVLEIAAWNQANAVRQVTVKRGLDVRDYVLVAFGGSGPLQAGRLVDVLGLKAALVPPEPGNVSAFGLLTVDIKNDYVVTLVQRDDALDLKRLNASFQELEAKAHRALTVEGFADSSMRFVRSADMRYFGQAWEVRVEVPPGELDRPLADQVVERFHAAHERVYGYSYRPDPGAPPQAGQAPQRVEWVNLRVSGIGPLQRPEIQPRSPRLPGAIDDRAGTGHRRVYFEAGDLDAPIYTRDRLQPGDCIEGPAIVEEFGSTTVIFPRQRASVDDFANLRIERLA